MMQALTTSILVSSALLWTVQASRDDSYYRPGSGNPNVYQKMYWKDAGNILEDLSQFQTLYVEFQHCAWTWMNEDEDEDEESVDENDYWYMGKVAPFGANVAFSLYGSLRGESFQGCGANTFINSFYTKNGFSEFVYAMSNAGVSAFQNYDFSGYSAECQGYSGVGCDYTNGFAMHSYSTQECNPAAYTGVSDNMQYLNQAMQSASCVPIYDASSGKNWNGYNYTTYGTPLELLDYSEACFYQNFWSPDGQCPDPHNKIEFYQENFNRGVTNSKKQDPFEQYTKQMAESKELLNAGTAMLAMAAVLLVGGLLVPAVKRALISKHRTKKTTSDTTSQVPVFVTPKIAATKTPKEAAAPATAPRSSSPGIMDDAEILSSRSFEEPAPTPAVRSGYKKKFKGMFVRK